MRLSLLITTLIVIVLQIGCQSKPNNDNPIHKKNGKLEFIIDPNYSLVTDAENKINNLEFIPLERTDESLISGIAKLEKDSTTGRWYVLGKKQKNTIFVFENNGNFVKKIKNIGNGPGEYHKINSFYLSDGKWIEILDGRRQKLIKYELQNDSIISERKVPFYAWEYTYMDDGNLVFYKNSQANNLEDQKYFYKILILDNELDLLHSYFPFELQTGRQNISVMQPRTLTKTKDNIIFNEFLSDTVYNITEHAKDINFILDLGKYDTKNLDEKNFDSGKEKLDYFFNQKNEYIVGAQYITEKSNNIGFNFIFGDNVYTYLYNKMRNKAIIIKKINFGAGKIAIPPPIQIIGDKYVGIYSWQMLSEIQEHKLQKDKKLYANLIKAKKVNKNPVIALYNINF